MTTTERRTWPRLDDPPLDVRKVRSEDGTVWTRMDTWYWSSPGWPNGVVWGLVLRWGSVTEVDDKDDDED
jgi:hypothetical protein